MASKEQNDLVKARTEWFAGESAYNSRFTLQVEFGANEEEHNITFHLRDVYKKIADKVKLFYPVNEIPKNIQDGLEGLMVDLDDKEIQIRNLCDLITRDAARRDNE